MKPYKTAFVRVSSSLLSLGLLSVPMACSKTTTDRDPVVAPDPGPMPEINRLSSARCEREQACGNVGPGKSYESNNECVTKLDADGYAELNSADCKAGLDNAQFDKCLQAIHAEECNSPIASLERLTDCRSSALCRD